MRVDLLKNIVSSIVGQPASEIVDLLHNKKNVNEFLIAKKLKLTINQTRNILYRLADEGLVSFIRKKDTKKGGWYIYFWTLSSGKSLMKFREKLLGHLNDAKSKLGKRLSERFFKCINCELEFNEEESLANTYFCSECGEVLELSSSDDEIEHQKKECSRLETLLAEVDSELEVLNKKNAKAREKAILAAAKLLKEKRMGKRAMKKKAEEKEKASKNGVVKKAKKVVKKKAKKVVKKKAKKVVKKKVVKKAKKGAKRK